VLDKGVVDAFARISLVGIEILTVEARVVVASVDTFHYAEEIAKIE
jgi:Gas vesicle protein.